MIVPSWLIIGIITFAIAFLLNRLSVEDRQWFFRLRRPRWLTFEFAIPLIWIFIFVCGILSASLIWDASISNHKKWIIMTVYLLLEVAILAYTPIMCKTRSLMVGTIIGGVGFFIGLILATLIFPINKGAFFLLLPYLFWSPIGTYVTWKMITLNRSSA